MVRQAFVAVGASLLALVLTLRLYDGSMAFLVQGWYLPILLVTVAVLALLAGISAYEVVMRGGRYPIRLQLGALVRATLILGPIALGLLVSPRPLGGSSLGTGSALNGRQLVAPQAAQPTQRNVYQWSYEFANSDPRSLIGQPVDVTGFVYHGKDDPDGVFEVARFVVACCIADATGATLPVRWSEGAGLAGDSWVHVQGQVAASPGGGPVVLATSVDPVEAPSNPYIYP